MTAMLDGAGDGIVVAQHSVGAMDVAMQESGAYFCRADVDAIDDERLVEEDVEVEVFSEKREPREVVVETGAELVVVAQKEEFHAQLTDQDLGSELAGGELRGMGIEVDSDNIVDAGALEIIHAFVESGEEGDVVVGVEHEPGVVAESDDERFEVKLTSHRGQMAKHLPVTEMDAIEHADGDSGGAR